MLWRWGHASHGGVYTPRLWMNASRSSPAHSSTIFPSATRYTSKASQRSRRPVRQGTDEAAQHRRDVGQAIHRAECAAMPLHLRCQELGGAVRLVLVEDSSGVGAHEFLVRFELGCLEANIAQID